MKPQNCLIPAIEIFHLLHPKISITSNLGIIVILHLTGISRYTSLSSVVCSCVSQTEVIVIHPKGLDFALYAIHFHSISITSLLKVIQLSLHGILVLLWIDSAFQLCVINTFHKPTPTFGAKTSPWGAPLIAYLQPNTSSLDTVCCHLCFNQFSSHLTVSLLIPLFLT